MTAVQAFWNGMPVVTSARYVPRYAWTTASINVDIKDLSILRTDGMFKFTGKQTSTFDFDGRSHTAELTWGRGLIRSFPFKLWIDGTLVTESRVPIQNWALVLWPWGVLVGLVLWHVFHH